MSLIKYVIPARKGSKGFPLKNRILLNYTLNAIPREYKKDIIITTDDQHIKDQAKACKIKAISRPPRLASDIADMKSVLLHVVNRCWLEHDNIIVLLYLTYPERTWTDIEKALLYFNEQKARSLLCRMPAITHPYLCVYRNGRQVVKHSLYRRQDYPECFEISHFISIIQVSEVSKLNLNLYNEDTVYYSINKKIDIDHEKDLNEYRTLHNAE